MKRILSRLALLGMVAAGTLGAGVSTSWSCAPDSTDCSMDLAQWNGERPGRPDVGGGRPDIGGGRPDVGGRPDWGPGPGGGRPDWRPGDGGGRPDWRPDPSGGRHEWRPDDRPGRPDWRPDRGHVPRYDRHRQPGDDSGRWREHEWRRDGWRREGWRRNDWGDRVNGGIYFNYYADRWPGYDDGYYDQRPRYRVRMTQAHVEWCYNRYRTYRASDNTYKPNRHTRVQCISPYR